ncbi:MAG: hypothetical protein P1P64_00220 [Treponemataceae bacterium]
MIVRKIINFFTKRREKKDIEILENAPKVCVDGPDVCKNVLVNPNNEE